MKTAVKKELGYQVPALLQDKEAALQYLADCGLKRPKSHLGKLYFILNRLRVDGHVRRFRYNEPNGWVSMDTNVIKGLFGDLKYHNAIINKLMADGFVECNRSYSNYEGYNYAMGYRLTEVIQSDCWNVVKVKSSSCSTTDKILQWTRSQWTPVDNQLYSKLTRIYIEEIPFFEKTTPTNFLHFNCDIRDAIMDGVDKSDAATLKARYSFYKDCYLNIRVGEWRYQPDRFGRRHNNLTNLPKVLRDKYLYVLKDGKQRRLCTIDIRNSQPLLTVTLLYPTIEYYDLYKELAESGHYYELLARGYYSEEKRDNEIKPSFFTYLYGEPEAWYVKSSLFYKLMEDQFEAIHKYFTWLKCRKGYEFPSQRMQKAESDLMIHYVCKHGMKLKTVFAQVYDSILCLEEDIASFDLFIKEAFGTVNLDVQTKIKYRA